MKSGKKEPANQKTRGGLAPDLPIQVTPLPGSNESHAARGNHRLLQLNPLLRLGSRNPDVHVRPAAENFGQKVLAAVPAEYELSTACCLVAVLVDKAHHRNGFIAVLDHDEPGWFLFNRISTRGEQMVAHGKVEGDLRLNRSGLRE